MKHQHDYTEARRVISKLDSRSIHHMLRRAVSLNQSKRLLQVQVPSVPAAVLGNVNLL
jgi:hypothetical protein